MLRGMISGVLLLSVAAVSVGQAQSPGRAKTGMIPIRIETSLGNIDAVLDSVHAPNTVTNFLRYVDGKLYDSASFFRSVTLANQPNDSVKIEVIQGGKGSGKTGFPAIPLERTSVTGLKHVDGTLSMARSGPDTGTDQFFIVIGNQPELNFGGKRNKDGQGFAAFGQVSAGMEIVKKIQAMPVNVQNLVSRVTILRIIRRD